MKSQHCCNVSLERINCQSFTDFWVSVCRWRFRLQQFGSFYQWEETDFVYNKLSIITGGNPYLMFQSFLKQNQVELHPKVHPGPPEQRWEEFLFGCVSVHGFEAKTVAVRKEPGVCGSIASSASLLWLSAVELKYQQKETVKVQIVEKRAALWSCFMTSRIKVKQENPKDKCFQTKAFLMLVLLPW